MVINSVYRQIICRRGIPFEMTVPPEPNTFDSMTANELDAKLWHSCAQSLAEDGRPFKEDFDELERGLV